MVRRARRTGGLHPARFDTERNAMDGGAALKKAKTELEQVDIEGVLEMLPHRYPMLMVDRVRDVAGDAFGIGIKNITYNEPQFQGHFPSEPVWPGVLILEGMAQTAGVLCVIADRIKPPLVYMMTVDKAKFRRPVKPGDVLEYHMTKQRQRGNVYKYLGEAKVDGRLVAEAVMSAMIVRG